MKSPCYKCPDRKVETDPLYNCHSDCEKFIPYAEEKKKEREKRLRESGLKSMTADHETRNEKFRKRVGTSRFSGR